MVDYRNRPFASPVIWCPKCTKLVPMNESKKVMKTVYKIHKSGLFPFGVCKQHVE